MRVVTCVAWLEDPGPNGGEARRRTSGSTASCGTRWRAASSGKGVGCRRRPSCAGSTASAATRCGRRSRISSPRAGLPGPRARDFRHLPLGARQVPQVHRHGRGPDGVVGHERGTAAPDLLRGGRGVARLLELPTTEVSVLVMRRHYDGLPVRAHGCTSPRAGQASRGEGRLRAHRPKRDRHRRNRAPAPAPHRRREPGGDGQTRPRRRGWHDRVRPRRAEPARPTPLLRHPRDPRRARRLPLSPRAVLLPYRAAASSHLNA